MPTSSLPKQFELHGQPVTIVTSDLEDTIVQYENGAQRFLDTGDLFDYLNLKVFPAKSRFCRAVDGKKEIIIIEEVDETNGFYKWEMLSPTSGSKIVSTAYTELIKWHMGGDKLDPEIELLPGTKLYTPKMIEADPQQRIAQMQAEIEALTQRITELSNDLVNQEAIHNTRVLVMADEIERLEKKAAIMVPVAKKFEFVRDAKPADLERFSSAGWTQEFMQVENGAFYAVFSRPADVAAPTQPAAHAAATQIIIPPKEEKVIARTFNHGSRGDTRKITVSTDDPVIKEAFERGQAVYKRVVAEGMSAINQASRSFNQGANRV